LQLFYSFIIPVYNRPNEISELLRSFLSQRYLDNYEIIIVEDGSTNRCDDIVVEFQDKLNIRYLDKKNNGAGQSRNYGMLHAKGNYFIILDSDVILPNHYFEVIKNTMQQKFTDAFGAPDKAHYSFTNIQKAIDFAMTSFLTTGGLRNNKGSQKFQLRSFNMGLSKEAFEKTKGFSKQHFGEDIDLSFRLDKLGLTKQFILDAYVYHKRRTDWSKFYKQTFNFGAARPILNIQHQKTAKITYWFPSIFIISFLFSLVALTFGYSILYFLFVLYFLLLFMNALLINKNIQVAFYAVQATFIQFLGYGFGFIRSQFRLYILKKTKKETFPKMFSQL